MELLRACIAVLCLVSIYLVWRLRAARLETEGLHNQLRGAREQSTQTSDRLAREQAVRTALVETMVDPVFFVDNERRILFLNNPARKLGKDEAEPGHSLIEAVRSYDLDNVVDETLTGRNELPREVTINQRLYRVRVSTVFQAEAPAGAIVILRDISELQRLGRARRDFVANISHELRTPLTAIRLLVDTLKMYSDKQPEQRAGFLDQISAQVDALTQLAQEMYDLALIESGQVPMRMVRTSLGELAGRVITRLSPQAERAGVQLINQIAAESCALVDPEQISRVLSNLLHNAIKFTPHGNVTVMLADCRPPNTNGDSGQQPAPSSDDYLTVAVQDTGVGISRADLPRIFERFYKVSRARGQGGTGLGLAIAKHIVEAHSGHIWVESIEGKGATFYFTVPQEG